ncbi:MAG: TonB-dependent receptor plug domain-containing protein, partial [Chloroflexota bacterium]
MNSTRVGCDGAIVRSERFSAYLGLVVATVLLASFANIRTALAGGLENVAQFDIPAQPLDKALLEFGAQAHVQIMFAWESSTGQMRTREIMGRYSGGAVLAALLRGTGLAYSLHGNTIEVIPVKSSSAVGAEPAKGADPLTGSRTRPAQDPPRARSDDPKEMKRKKEQQRQQKTLLQVITITGTHIRSVTGSILPIQTFTREDMSRSGLGTVSAFLETLPANFSGGMSETTDAQRAGGAQSANDFTLGTGVNLRGLGNDATLVLLDGHRIAPADLVGNFIDLSLFPEDAVGKIDVVTDGASAIYGSDAVGGVVNISTRQRFNGAETRARFASDDRNDIHESEIGQTFGRAWGSGSALASYEFYDETPLSAADRDFTESVPLPFTLLPEQVRQSVLATVHQSIAHNVLLYS